MNYLSNALNTESLEKSPDFTAALKGKNTPLVLVNILLQKYHMSRNMESINLVIGNHLKSA